MSDEYENDYEGYEEPAFDYVNLQPQEVNIKRRQEFINEYYKISKKYANLRGEPSEDVTQIFEKTSEEAASEDVSVSQVAKEDSGSSGTGSQESNDLLKNISTMAGTQFVQMFYDMYMSPLNSDIEWRLGKVTGTKTNFQNVGKFKSSGAFNGAQFDKYGRIDTTTNFKMKTHIDGLDDGSIFGYDEFYVNWFFPPFNQSAFKNNASISDFALKDITQRVWNDSHQCWEINGEKDETTYDIMNMMSCRPNPTYRLTAFKSVNDNIQWLQKIYENTTGIVSTYLTEWDLSLYIQEGLLEDAKKYPIINLCYRILDDNPMGWRDTRAFSFGLLNAALSKTPVQGVTPNTLDWNPADYPLSAYWTKYDSADRGDGLDNFYDVALNGHLGGSLTSLGYSADIFNDLNIKEKIKFYDDVNAAYSGWTSYEGMKTYQVLYSSPDDGLNQIDLTHITEPMNRKNIKDNSNGVSSSKNNSTDNGLPLLSCINSVIEAKYDIDDSLGYKVNEPRILKDEKPKKLLGMRDRWVYRKKNWITGDWEECGAQVTPRKIDFITLYWQKPKKGLIFTPIWRPTPIRPFFGIAKKASELSGASSFYGKNLENFDASDPMSSSPTSDARSAGMPKNAQNNSPFERTANGYYKVPEVSSAESYADHFGISQRSPALTGGPHGKYYSPKTIQAYFEENNAFLKDVPRIDPSFEKTLDFSSHFIGNNGYYSYPCDENVKINPSRSPSYALAILKHGFNKDNIKSDIKVSWEINKVEIQNATLNKKPKLLNRILSNIVAFFAPWTSQYSTTISTEQKYRLKISGSVGKNSKAMTRVIKKVQTPVNIYGFGNPYGINVNGSISKIKKSWEKTSQSYSNNEIEFVKKNFGIDNYGDGKMITSEWKDIFFFQNNSLDERLNDGPNMIFQVPCRVNSYKYVSYSIPWWYWLYIFIGWTGLFSSLGIRYETKIANYIEVDAEYKFSTKFFPMFSAIKNSTSSFSNLGTDADSTTDIPDDSYRTMVASTPWVYEQKATSSIFTYVQDFLGQAKNKEETSIFGFGWTSGIPAQDENTPIGKIKYQFENNETDDALNKSLINLISTSTFYKSSEDENEYAMPCIVQNDVPFRVLIKNSLHQVSWLKQAKDSFIENVDFAEVQKIMKSSVEPSIYKASKGKKVGDVSYSYWIDKAIEFFGKDKSYWDKKFSNVISLFETFNNSMSSKIGKTALSWSYKDFEEAFDLISSIQKNNTEISEFMTAYIHVLYEYRKYFLNKRFNKVGGTMTSMKYLESVVPLMVNSKTEPENKTLDSVDTLPANIGAKEYPVSFYEVQNSNSQKIKAAVGEISPLEKDKTKTIYVKVDYVSRDEAEEYMSKLRKHENIQDDEHLIYIPRNDKWAKLPVSGMYQYISKEWERNEKIRVWNKTCNPGAERTLNEDITNCIFQIDWAIKENKVAYEVLRSVDTSLSDTKEKYGFNIPYSFSESAASSIPNIKFGITNGVNLSKIGDVTAALELSNSSAMDIICTTRDVDDFWQIQIPSSEMPLTTGYKTKLKIKTYVPTPTPSISQETLAGPMTFTIWPITEDQVDVTPGIGVNMTKQAEELRKTRTSIDTGAQ